MPERGATSGRTHRLGSTVASRVVEELGPESAMELDIKQRISFRPFTGDFPPIKPRHVERQTKKAEEAASSGSLFARVFEEVLEANLVDACHTTPQSAEPRTHHTRVFSACAASLAGHLSVHFHWGRRPHAPHY